ncbi:MAG: zf-HC2 domain-containing protein [Planctomycetota bacterium]|nr:zf-HC2 domain-containing protein [Planctomycetota bacterium]
MSREEFTRLLGPYLDGELSEEQRETVERYLASSEEYRKLAAEAEELTRLAKNDRPPEVSEERWRKMLSEIREGGTNQPFAVVSSRPRWLAPLAGLAAILIIGLFILSADPNSSEKPADPRKDYAETTDEEPIRIKTLDDDDEEKERKPLDPRFDE